MDAWQLWIACDQEDLAELLSGRVRDIAGPAMSCELRSAIPPGALAARLSAEEPAVLRDTLVLVDVSAHLNAFNADPMGIAADLVLSFPEIGWIFLGLEDKPVCADPELQRLWQRWSYVQIEDVSTLESRIREHDAGLRFLFDPYGLRAHLRWLIQSAATRTLGAGTVSRPPRVRRAATVDEEISFAYLTAYTAYRSGFAVVAVTTLRGLAAAGRGRAGGEGLSLSIEDVQLSFPDDCYKVRHDLWRGARPEQLERALGLGSRSLQDTVEARSRLLPGLEAERHILLTSQSGEPEETGTDWIFLRKPFPGIHWLASYLPDGDRTKEPGPAVSAPAPHRHSTPGALQTPVRRLLERSRKIRRSSDLAVTSCVDFIHGALLALEARQLLNRTSLATSFEALGLQHAQEVAAECVFHGVSNPVRIEPRLEELRREIRFLVQPEFGYPQAMGVRRWRDAASRAARALRRSAGPQRILRAASCLAIPWKERLKTSARKQYWSAYSRVLRDVRNIFNSSGQFEEETACLNQLRKAVRNEHCWAEVSRESGSPRWRRWLSELKAFTRRAGSWYFALGVRSITWAVGLLLFWIAVFGTALWLLHGVGGQMPPRTGHTIGLLPALQSSTLSLLTIEPQLACTCDPMHNSLWIFLVLDMVVGYVHLGLLLSLVYQWISRR